MWLCPAPPNASRRSDPTPPGFHSSALTCLKSCRTMLRQDLRHGGGMAKELEGARIWLTGHGLTDVEPTPLLATRLAARWRKRVIASVLLAVFLIAIALSYVTTLADG